MFKGFGKRMSEKKTTKYPFRKCPRNIGVPEQTLCTTEDKFFYLLNKYNGMKRKVYCSVCTCNDIGSFLGSPIELVPFDLDSNNCLLNVRKFYEYCLANDYECFISFSTGGFWGYISTTCVPLKNPKVAMANFQMKVAEDLGFVVDKGKKGDLDISIVGDIARITRAINTKDLRRDRYCIVLRNDEIYLTYEQICDLARKPRFEYYWYGNTQVDLTQYDNGKAFCPSKVKIKSYIPEEEKKEDYDSKEVLNLNIESFLPCVQSWLKEPGKDTWIARYYFAVYCAETAVPKAEADRIAKEYFSKTKRSDEYRTNYHHFDSKGFIQRAYDNKFFPNCDTLIDKGLCPGKCKFYKSGNSPIYEVGR